MQQWCGFSEELHVMPGAFLQAILFTHSGLPLHDEDEFLDKLSQRIMMSYEGTKSLPLISFPDIVLERRLRTRHHYRRLFDENGKKTSEFVTLASESLGLWIELSTDDVLYTEGNPPHGTDPAFDVISIVQQNSGNQMNPSAPELRVIQVKATRDNLQQNGSVAVAKFERLERGDYDAELANRLELIAIREDRPRGVKITDLIYDRHRQYRVTAIHSEELDGFKIMTTFEEKIPGPPRRRSARLVHVHWSHFWDRLAERVYERLA